jgi:hypothetical protein
MSNKCSTMVIAMGERDMERARRLKAEREYVARAARWWNREARMDQYAGWRSPERAFSMGSLLAGLAIEWFDLSDRTRSQVLHVARGVLGERSDGKQRPSTPLDQ